MKIETSNLEGMALCYAICMIRMPHLVWGETIGIHHASNQIVVPELPEPQCYSPFSDWAMFGPIMEQESVSLTDQHGCRGMERWLASLTLPNDNGLVMEWGPTQLVAARRCYVASQMGDLVDVPAELLGESRLAKINRERAK